MHFDPEYIHTLQKNNLTQTSQLTYYKSIRNKNKKSQIQALKSLWLEAKNIMDLKPII